MKKLIAACSIILLVVLAIQAQSTMPTLAMRLEVGAVVTDVVTTNQGKLWLITADSELILWDHDQKSERWRYPIKSDWGYGKNLKTEAFYPGRAAMNNQHVYLLGPTGLTMYQIDLTSGDLVKTIDVVDEMGHRALINGIAKIPGATNEFLLTGHVDDLKNGAFQIGSDQFVVKAISGGGLGLLSFVGAGKFLKENVYAQAMYGFQKARDFSQLQTDLRTRWKPERGTTFGYLPSYDGKFLYRAHFWRSVNYKKEYLIEKSYLLTKKPVASIQTEDEPLHFSYAGKGDLLLVTTAKDKDLQNQRWLLIDTENWSQKKPEIPFTNPATIIYDQENARNFIADTQGGLWVLDLSGHTGNPVSFQLDGGQSEVSFEQIKVAQRKAQDQALIDRIRNDPTSAVDDPNYYGNMAFQLSDEGQYLAAYEAFKKTYQAYPDNQFSNAFMGWYTILSGTLDGVKPLLQKATELAPFDPIAHQLYAYYYLLSGDQANAEAEMKKAISFKVDNEGMGEKNTDWDMLRNAGYQMDFTSFDRWVENLVNPDLQKRAQNFQRFQTAQQQASPRNKYNQMTEVIRQEQQLKVPRAAVLGSAMSEAATAGRKIGEVKQAMEYGARSVTVLEPFGDMALLVGANVNAGHAFNQGFRFDKARPYYEEALRLMDLYEGQFEIYRVGALNGLGGVFDNQGLQSRALTYYEQALEVARASGNKNDEAIALGNIATVYISQGKNVSQAIQMLDQGTTIYQRSGDEVALANNYNNIAFGFMLLNRPFQAIDYFKKAEVLYTKLGMTSGLALVNNAIGKLLIGHNRKIEALTYYQKALQYIDERSDPEMAKTVYANLAGGLLGQEQYGQAATYAEKAIALNEEMLKTADLKAIRGLRSSTNNYYRIVSLARHRQNDYAAAFTAHERNRSREMLKKIGSTELIGTKEAQGMLNEDQVLIDYSVVHLKWEVHSHLFPIVITKNQVIGKEYSDSTLIKSLRQEGEERFVSYMNQRSMLQQIREFVSEKGIPDNVAQSLIRDSNLEKTIEFYRHLIKEPNARNELLRKSYARVFYDLLIGKIKEQLVGKEELIIIPDGPLAFLPFETLIDENGKYLAESYRIKYAQSASVLHALEKRTYDPSRKPLIAFGGPTFERIPEEEISKYPGEDEFDFNQFQTNYYEAEERRDWMRPIFIQLGFTAVKPLVGTIEETNKIKEIVPGTALYQEDEASEEQLKALDESKALASYKVLHFATHGKAFSEIPELSNLALAQFAHPQSHEDGFLRVPEIERLTLKADFVNLSACETAMGRLYSSEGVIGLTQAFLVAGANSISVTQWPVSDEGTAIFMTEMYRKVFQEQQSYLDAFAATKIEFIQGKYGERFRHPDYWGPFVYYGK